MKTLAPARLTKFFSKIQLLETTILLSITLLLPILIHNIPNWGTHPWGARLLPIYYAPLIAALFYPVHVSFIVALCPPWINLILTGLPKLPYTALMTYELLIFVLLITFLVTLSGRKWYYGPLSYFVAKVIIFLLLFTWPPMYFLDSPLSYFENTLFVAIPGIILLGLVNWTVIKIAPSEKTDRQPVF